MVDSLARALKLDQDEHDHLRDLAARAAHFAPEPPPAPSRTVRPQLKLLLETLRPNPAYVTSRTLDVLAANPGALALYTGLDEWPAGQRNIARFLFLHPTAREIYADWELQIRGCVARLRAPWPAPNPTPPTSPPSPASCCSRAPSSPNCGSATTSPARPPRTRRPSTTPRSARSPSASRACNSKARPANGWTCTWPSPAPPTHDAMILLDMTAPRHTKEPAAHQHH